MRSQGVRSGSVKQKPARNRGVPVSSPSLPAAPGSNRSAIDAVEVRPLERDDRAGLAAPAERLSPRARYLRSAAPEPRLTERDLDRLTDIDHHRREALLAIDPRAREGIAVARYAELPDEPGVVDVAVTVGDAWQRRGLGSAMLARLIARAREEPTSSRRTPAPARCSEARASKSADPQAVWLSSSSGSSTRAERPEPRFTRFGRCGGPRSRLRSPRGRHCRLRHETGNGRAGVRRGPPVPRRLADGARPAQLRSPPGARALVRRAARAREHRHVRPGARRRGRGL